MNDYDNKVRLYKTSTTGLLTTLLRGQLLQISIDIFMKMTENLESLIWGGGKVYFQCNEEIMV